VASAHVAGSAARAGTELTLRVNSDEFTKALREFQTGAEFRQEVRDRLSELEQSVSLILRHLDI